MGSLYMEKHYVFVYRVFYRGKSKAEGGCVDTFFYPSMGNLRLYYNVSRLDTRFHRQLKGRDK